MRLLALTFALFVAVLVGLNARADGVDNPAKDKASKKVGALFEKIDEQLRIQGVFELPLYSFYLGAPAIQGVAYLPSWAPRLGPRILWKDIGATVTFALPVSDADERRRGNTQSTEVILNRYWRQNAIDAYYLRDRGFYVTSPFRELSVHKPERYPQLPDAVVTNLGFNWYYVFNPDRYSLKAAFDQSEFQTESGGSWLLSPFYNHLEMSLGDRFIGGVGDDSVTTMPNLAAGRFDTAGASFGYGYAYIWGRFFASAIGALGPGVEYQRVYPNDSGVKTNVNLAWKINVNLAMGFNYHDYVGGIKGLLDSLSSSVSGTEVASNLISGQLFFGARF